MKRLIFAAAVMTGFLNGLAYAQDKEEKDPMVLYEEQRKREREQADAQYQRTLKRTNQGLTAQPANDPWANMRGPAEQPTKKR